MQLEYFQLLDRIVKLDREAKTIECLATVPMQSTVFEGHFPGHPLMPGTLLIESMAQTSGYMLLDLLGFERMPFLIQVEKAKLRTFVEPGAVLTVYGKLVHDGSGFAATSGSITRDGKPIADAELRFRTAPFPTPDLKAKVQEFARKFGWTG
ncbi:MAG: 3-hydroxyacyl-ACP dehydratase FabZ family protein [Alphaproteobacteria bacterium]